MTRCFLPRLLRHWLPHVSRALTAERIAFLGASRESGLVGFTTHVACLHTPLHNPDHR